MAFLADDWRPGPKGAEGVARRLRKLGPGWRVLHDLPHGPEGAHIDHLVIGRAGVFVVNVKQLTDARLAGRQPDPRGSSHAAVAAFEGRVASRRLTRAAGEDVAAWPLLLAAGGGLDVRKGAADVYLIAEQLLVPWLKSLAPVYSEQETADLYAHASDPATWSVAPR